VLSYRASLAFVLSAALTVLPAFGSRSHHASTGSHAKHSDRRSTASISTHSSRAERGTAARADRGDSPRSARGKHAVLRGSRSRRGSLRATYRRGGTTSRPARVQPVVTHTLRGQQSIQPDRAMEIQQALVREHYLTSDEASGQWDATTQAAMQKYQADQGWQTKLMPDSRALKKLGLGPDYSNAINASGSSFAAPPQANTIPPVQAAGFTAASGVNE
jgi:hypothetical protein